jgi:hypothetical protein
MAYEKKLGSGVLFANDKKQTEKQPDYSGDLLLDQDYGKGTTIKLSAWRKSTPKGHLISISVNNYKADKDQVYPKPAYGRGMDDEVPF